MCSSRGSHNLNAAGDGAEINQRLFKPLLPLHQLQHRLEPRDAEEAVDVAVGLNQSVGS